MVHTYIPAGWNQQQQGVQITVHFERGERESYIKQNK